RMATQVPPSMGASKRKRTPASEPSNHLSTMARSWLVYSLLPPCIQSGAPRLKRLATAALGLPSTGTDVIHLLLPWITCQTATPTEERWASYEPPRAFGLRYSSRKNSFVPLLGW